MHILGNPVCRLWNPVSRIFVTVKAKFCLSGLPDLESSKPDSFWVHSAQFPVFRILNPVSRIRIGNILPRNRISGFCIR